MRYGLRRRLKRGVRIRLRPTFKCNLNCPYCGNMMKFLPKRPMEKRQISADEYLKLLDRFPMKIQEVWISGGEPTLYYDFIPLVEGLLKRKFMVTIFSNLMNDVLTKLPYSDRIRIEATYHGRMESKRYNSKIFLRNYHNIKNRVDVDEIEDNQIPFSISKPWNCDIEDAQTERPKSFWFNAYGQLFMNGYDEQMSIYNDK